MKARSSDGRFTVEVITLTGTGEWLRVKEHGFFPGAGPHPEELAKFGIDLSE